MISMTSETEPPQEYVTTFMKQGNIRRANFPADVARKLQLEDKDKLTWQLNPEEDAVLVKKKLDSNGE